MKTQKSSKIDKNQKVTKVRKVKNKKVTKVRKVKNEK